MKRLLLLALLALPGLPPFECNGCCEYNCPPALAIDVLATSVPVRPTPASLWIPEPAVRLWRAR